MKKLTILGIVCSIVLISCTESTPLEGMSAADGNSSVDGVSKTRIPPDIRHPIAGDLEGTWELVGVGSEDSTDSRFTSVGSQRKIIGESDFITVWQDLGNTIPFWRGGFNGGPYTYEDGLYSETYEYFSFIPQIGLTTYWQISIDDDRFTMVRVTEEGEVIDSTPSETWKRTE